MVEQQLRDMVSAVLSHAKADHTEVWLTTQTEGSTRFANNLIMQNLVDRTSQMRVQSARGQQVGQAAGTDFSAEGLRRLVERSEEEARQARPDPEYLQPLGSQQYTDSRAYFPTIEDFGPTRRAEAVRAAATCCADAGLQGSGSLTNHARTMAYGNSAGGFVYDRVSSARMAATALTANSSGWAQQLHPDVAVVNPTAIGAQAARRALDARDPEALPPGRYTVVLEAAAVADMLMFLLDSLDAKAVDQGTSALSGKIGTTIAAKGITIGTDPCHPDCPTAKFVDGGLPARPFQWICDGDLVGLIHSRFWAQQQGVEPTGPPPNIVMSGSDATTADLVAGVTDGVLVNRLWYLRTADARRLLVSGMTRDGLYRIRDGEVVSGLNNMRFSMSVLDMLAHTTHLGRPEPAGSSVSASVPSIIVDDWYFSNQTEF